MEYYELIYLFEKPNTGQKSRDFGGNSRKFIINFFLFIVLSHFDHLKVPQTPNSRDFFFFLSSKTPNKFTVSAQTNLSPI